jgi:hypothetical protein
MRRVRAATLVALLAVATGVHAFEAELVPASRRPQLEEIEGTVSIGGEDGSVRVTISGVNDPAGDPLDGGLIVIVKARIGTTRRRFTFPLTVDTGDGETTGTLGLPLDARVAITDVRVRSSGGHTIALAGVVTAPTVAPTPPAPPPPDLCPPALATCQADLAECNDELDICEEN